MKLRLYADKETSALFSDMAARYSAACTSISEYVFNNGFVLNFMKLQESLYQTVARHIRAESADDDFFF
jgi:hypothetical protein